MIRSALVFVIASSVLACGGATTVTDAGSTTLDAGVIDAGTMDAGAMDAGTMDAGTMDAGGADAGRADAGLPDAGPPMHYVVDALLTPVNSAEARAFGLDLDQDGVTDNQFGSITASLSQSGFDFRGPIANSISHGTAITLLSVSASGVVRTFVGENPRPAACANLSDMVCGRHLDGGTFDLSPGTTSDALFGVIDQGALQTGFDGGQVPLRLALLGAPVIVHLQHARVAFTGVTSTRIGTGVLAGGITPDERDYVLYPSMANSFSATITHDCASLSSPPTCGCVSGTPGATFVQLFDANHDCQVSVAELQTNTLFQSLFTPDVMLAGQPMISFGVKLSANAATFAE